jgi:hypothetical protein
MSFIIGLIMTIVGGIVVVKSEKVLEFFGRSEFFEDKLGTAGGSRLGYKLLGLIVVFLGILTMTGLIQGFMEFVLSPLLKYSRSQ